MWSMSMQQILLKTSLKGINLLICCIYFVMQHTFRSVKNATLSEFTINNYINYMQEAFILSEANRYDIKGKKYISTPYKIYFEDLGLRYARLDFRQIEETHLMENII